MSNPQFSQSLVSKILPDILDVRCLSYFTGLSARTCCALLRSGELPGRKLGGKWLMNRTAVLAALRQPMVECADCCREVTRQNAVCRPGSLPVCRACAPQTVG